MQIKLLDLDNGREVVVEMDGRAHVVDLIQRLRELGVIRPNETAMLGVLMDSRRIAYVPAANLEQLAAYARQRNAVIAFRRFPIHGYALPPR
jgi:NADH-quinone oxidoreductase subunit D